MAARELCAFSLSGEPAIITVKTTYASTAPTSSSTRPTATSPHGHVSYASVPGSGAAKYSLVDAATNRLALDTGGTTAWTMFDLHGNLASAQAEGSATVVSAFRYDAYGQLLDDYTAGSGATDTPWKFQGRLDVSPNADEALYDFGARMYRPSAGAFTQLDTHAGSAVNPLSMNRFLYAHANPVSLIDPDGHCMRIDGNMCIPKQKPKPAPTPKPTSSGPVAGQPGGVVTSHTPKEPRRPPLLPEDQSPRINDPFAEFNWTLEFIHGEMVRNSQEDWVVSMEQDATQSCGDIANPLTLGCNLDRASAWGGAAFRWIEHVEPGGVWDHKGVLDERLGLGGDPDDPLDDDYFYPVPGSRYEVYYDIWSNIHYGFVGTAAGWPATQLQVGQVVGGRTHPTDFVSVQVGIDLYNSYGPDVTRYQIHQAVLGGLHLWAETQDQDTRIVVPWRR